jgi:hypothetical protein
MPPVHKPGWLILIYKKPRSLVSNCTSFLDAGSDKKLSSLEKHIIPEWLEYDSIKSLTYEASIKKGFIRLS